MVVDDENVRDDVKLGREVSCVMSERWWNEYGELETALFCGKVLSTLGRLNLNGPYMREGRAGEGGDKLDIVPAGEGI